MCRSYRLPHTAFLSWPPVDQDKAVAYERWLASICPSCGTRAQDWDPTQGGHPYAYVAEVATCLGCATRDDLQHQLAEGEEQRGGQYIRLVPRGGV